MTTTTFQVTGMTCEHCERAVTEEVSAIATVTGVDVSAATGVLTVESASPVEDAAGPGDTAGLDTAALEAAVLAAVSEAGYSAVRA